MLANHVFWRLMHFYTPLLLLLQSSVLLLSILLTLIMMQSHRQSEFCANLRYHESDPGQAGYPTLNVYMAKFDPGWEGYPVWQCRRDQIKMRDHMDRRVTPPKRVPSPTWGPTGLHVNRPLNIVIHKQGSWVSLKFTNKQPTRMWHFFSHVRDEHI